MARLFHPKKTDTWRATGTAAEWAVYNPVLALGVFGLESDTKLLKLGDGVTAWNSLKYLFTMLDETTGLRWDDLRFEAQGINPSGSTSPATVDTDDGSLKFVHTANNIVAGFGQMPHAWAEGTDIKPHVHIQFKNLEAATSSVWQLEYKIANVNEDFPALWTALSVIYANPQNVNRHCLAAWTAINMTGKRDSCGIKWRISRLSNDANDTHTNFVNLLEFDIHYQSNSRGSILEYPS